MPYPRHTARPAIAIGLACAAAMTARAADAQPACDASFLALEDGAVWNYERAVPEDGEEDAGEPGQVTPEVPTDLTIEVSSIESDGGATIVELLERFGDIEQSTTIRCEDDGINVSPHSFLASGEPGGGVGIELAESDRDGPSYPRALRAGLRWTEWVEAEFEQTSAEGSGAVHPDGKIQVERELRVLRRVPMEVGERRFRPYRIDFSLSGRAMVEPEIDLGVEIPAGAVGVMWFQPGVGLLRAVNRFGHDWTIVLDDDED